MICKFCKQECKEYIGYDLCENHKDVHVEYFQYFFRITGKKYKVCFYTHSTYIDSIENEQLLHIHLKHNTGITPDNFESRVKTLLVFS